MNFPTAWREVTQNSISHKVINGGSEKSVYIGTNVEYAPYQEFGAGKYVEGGRPTPWLYSDEKGETHWTVGNKAKPFLAPAVKDHAATYRRIIAAELKKVEKE